MSVKSFDYEITNSRSDPFGLMMSTTNNETMLTVFILSLITSIRFRTFRSDITA